MDALEVKLTDKGIRFWRDVHDMVAGRMERQIERAIKLNPTLLLVLSAHSIDSDWVEHEVHVARDLEKKTGRDVLCPVALDATWKACPWSMVLMDQVRKYNILDFSGWQDDGIMERQFEKLVRGLRLFYE